MKHGGLVNKNICEKNQIFPMRQQKQSISVFPFISLTTRVLKGIKNTLYVEAYVFSMYAKLQLHPPYGY